MRKYLLAILLLVASSYYFVHNNQAFLTQKLTIWQIKCEGKQAFYLRGIARFMLTDLQYPSVQISYIDAKNELSQCVAGWEGTPLISKRIDFNTKMQYASTTKLFTSDLILQLVQQNRLHLNDKLVNLLPILQNKNYADKDITKITLSDLLTHRAGFDRNITPDPMFHSNQLLCPNHLANLQHYKLDFVPNSKMVYSNLGYCLLGEVLAQKHQKTFTQVLLQHPSTKNMQLIQATPEQKPIFPLANQRTTLPHFDYYALASSGGLIGTATDLASATQFMRQRPSPNIMDKPNNMPCNQKIVNGCHGYSGYHYQPDARLGYVWRNGSMVNVGSWVIMDNLGGSLAIISNYRNEQDNALTVSQNLLQYIYQTQLLNLVFGSLKTEP